MVQRDGVPIDIAERRKSFDQRLEIGPLFLGICRVPEDADAPHPLRLLRARRERPRRRRTAEQRDEFAALHSITSSASASILSGTVRPSAFAVLRLIVRS